MSNKLVDFLPETVIELEVQLKSDEERWGNTWKSRPIDEDENANCQEERAYQRFRDYYDQWVYAGTPIPWLKIMGECHICLTRERHPEELET